jgi:hypothetical protein
LLHKEFYGVADDPSRVRDAAAAPPRHNGYGRGPLAVQRFVLTARAFFDVRPLPRATSRQPLHDCVSKLGHDCSADGDSTNGVRIGKRSRYRATS